MRFRKLHDNGYVEFDFAIGEPEMTVELIMPLADYREFCHRNDVVYLLRDENEVRGWEDDALRLLDLADGTDELSDRHSLQGIIDAD